MRRSIFLAATVFLSACAMHDSKITYEDIARLSSPDGLQLAVPVEIADSQDEWQRGLMFRESLEGGMLFVFPKENPLSFWMKNTLIPLDVLYFDAKGYFVSVQTMSPCTKDPCLQYPSGGPASFALEVPAGYAAEHGIGEGWILARGEEEESSRSTTGYDQR